MQHFTTLPGPMYSFRAYFNSSRPPALHSVLCHVCQGPTIVYDPSVGLSSPDTRLYVCESCAYSTRKKQEEEIQRIHAEEIGEDVD